MISFNSSGANFQQLRGGDAKVETGVHKVGRQHVALFHHHCLPLFHFSALFHFCDDVVDRVLTLLTGPSHHVEIRMRRVVASDEAIVWELPSYLAASTQLDDGNGVIYCPVAIRLDKISDRPAVCIFSSRTAIGSLVSDWSEPSAACMI